jgi:hypothetical protein
VEDGETLVDLEILWIMIFPPLFLSNFIRGDAVCGMLLLMLLEDG